MFDWSFHQNPLFRPRRPSVDKESYLKYVIKRRAGVGTGRIAITILCITTTTTTTTTIHITIIKYL